MHHFNSKVALDAQKMNEISFLLLLFYDWARRVHLRPVKVYHLGSEYGDFFYETLGSVNLLRDDEGVKKWQIVILFLIPRHNATKRTYFLL